jgi:Rrf2 family protein
MKVSAKGEYACVAMMELAACHGDNLPVRIKSIADAQGIPPRFLVQILIQLKTHGLVRSVRGASGGYQLSRSPGAISLSDILRAVEDPDVESSLPRTRRVTTGRGKKSNGNGATAVTEPPPSAALRTLAGVWREIQQEQERILSDLSLAELLRRSRETTTLEYQI